MNLRVLDLGRMAYAPALLAQRRYHQRVLDGDLDAALLLVEHDPVITVSRRKTAPGNILASRQALAQLGIDVCETDRGGDVTYHGPGQLVAYPILRLNDLGLNLGRYLRLLEQVVIDTAATFGVAARRIDKCAGVWVVGAQPQAAKLAALGVRVERGVTLHGLALNVAPDLSHFQTIIPCGIRDKGVTSLRELRGGDRCPTMEQVKRELAEQLIRHVS